MKMKKYITILIAIVLAGCTTYKELSPTELSKYETYGSLYTLWYCGSDDEFHYFSHLCKTTKEFKVAKSELELPYTVPFGSLEKYILIEKLDGANSTLIKR